MPLGADYATAAPMLIRLNALRHVGKAWTAFDDAWRKVSRNEIGWTLAIALTFTIAHAYSLNTAQGRSWPVPVRVRMAVRPVQPDLPGCPLRRAHGVGVAARWLRYAAALSGAALLFWFATLLVVP